MVQVSSISLLEGEPYTPGLPREHVARAYGIAVDEVAKLGSAENPLGPSPKAAAAIERSTGLLDIYPDWTASLLRRAIGDIHLSVTSTIVDCRLVATISANLARSA